MRFVTYVCEDHRNFKLVPDGLAKCFEVAQIDDRILSTQCSVPDCKRVVRTFVCVQVKEVVSKDSQDTG